MNDFETWLDGEDVERLWKVCHGELDDSHASDEEIQEFRRLVTHAAMIKVAGKDYLEHTVH